MKPWDPPEERLYPVLDELLRDWAHGHPDRDSEVRVVGHRWSERTHEVKTFLAHNHVPYRWLEVDQGEEATRLLDLAGAGVDDLPVVALPDGAALRSPTTVELADALGLRTRAEKPLYDLCIVGAGPAGLAAAVYAASEGLADRRRRARRPGRPGRPERVDRELPRLPQGPLRRRPHPPRGGAGVPVRRGDGAGARRRRLRDPRPGARRAARRLRRHRGPRGARGQRRLLPAARGARASTASSAAASTTAPAPARRSRPSARTCTSWARPTRPARPRSTSPATPSGSCSSSAAPRWRRRCRSTSSAASSTTPNIEVRLQTEVVGARGRRPPRGASRSADRDAGTEEEVETSWLFVFIGAAPRTDWLGDAVARDDRGFVLTGPDLPPDPESAGRSSARPVRPRDERARRVRGRRRPAGQHEAGRLGRRRGRDVRLPRPPLPGDRPDAVRRAPRRRRSSTGSPTSRSPSSPPRARRWRTRRATASSTRADRPTTGGCCSTAASTWSAGSATRRR